MRVGSLREDFTRSPDFFLMIGEVSVGDAMGDGGMRVDMDDEALIVVVEEADVVAVEESENGNAGDNFVLIEFGTIFLTAFCKSIKELWNSSSNEEVDEDADDESYEEEERDSVGDEGNEDVLMGYPRGDFERN